MSGYIKLYRDLQDNPIWQEKPFTRGQAWVDIIFRCNHRCVRMGPQYKCVLVKRGSFVTSNVKLADAWGWSEKKVRRLMDYLQKSRMILYESMGKFCRYSVLNYAEYQALETERFEAAQCREDAEKMPRKNKKSAEHVPTNNNDNNKNNKKDVCPYKEIQNLFNEICTSLPSIQRLTDSRKDKLRVRWNEIPDIKQWEKLFETVESIPFLKGVNKDGWTATFDWLIVNDKNYLKVLEGNYKSNKQDKKPSQTGNFNQRDTSSIDEDKFYANTGDDTS